MASWASGLDQVRIKPSSYILVFSFALACSALWARTQEQPNSSQKPPAQTTAEPIPEGSPPTASLETSSTKPSSLLLPEATPVKLKLLHSLSSKTVVEDDPLNFAVAEDVTVKDKIVAKVGSVAIGRVHQAKPARMLGRGGQLALEMQYLKVGRVRVPLRGSQARTGANKKGETVALVVLFGLSGLIKHGSEIEVKEGSIFTAYVDRDTELPPQPEPVTQVQ
jgi:hypothetical protein